MDLDLHDTSKGNKTKKTNRIRYPMPLGETGKSTTTAQVPWTEVFGRRTLRASNAADPARGDRADLSVLKNHIQQR